MARRQGTTGGPLEYETAWQLQQRVGEVVRGLVDESTKLEKVADSALREYRAMEKRLSSAVSTFRDLGRALTDGAGYDGDSITLTEAAAAAEALLAEEEA